MRTIFAVIGHIKGIIRAKKSAAENRELIEMIKEMEANGELKNRGRVLILEFLKQPSHTAPNSAQFLLSPHSE